MKNEKSKISATPIQKKDDDAIAFSVIHSEREFMNCAGQIIQESCANLRANKIIFLVAMPISKLIRGLK